MSDNQSTHSVDDVGVRAGSVMADTSKWTAGRVAAACSVGVVFGVAPIFVGTFSLFIEPMTADLGIGRGALSLAFGAAGVGAAMSSPIAGALIDKIGPFRAVAIGTPVFGSAVAALAIVPSSALLIGLCYVLLAIAGGFGGILAFLKILTAWFPNNRGLVMGLVLGLSTGVGMVLCVSLTSYIIAAHGWRAAYLALGSLIVIISWPILLILLPRAMPKIVDPIPDRPADSFDAGSGRASIWALVVAMFCVTFATSGLSAHAAALFRDGGASMGQAATGVILIALAAAAGQVIVGAAMDRARSAAVAVPFVAAAIVGFGLICVFGVDRAVLLYLAAICIGLGSNLAFGAAPVMVARYFGGAKFGRYQGFVMSGAAIALGTGPAALGIGFDIWRSYEIPMIAMTAFLAVSAALLWIMPHFTDKESAVQK